MGIYSESEVPKKLEVGKTYTEKELLIFTIENKDSVILSEDRKVLNDWSTEKHTIKNIFKAYPHTSVGNAYQHPQEIKTYYII